ncbi:succinate dehydrogenase subunit C [Variovorax sp. HW608]|uniref:succinate dehydrogenase n=1 Tax=Variovorax sp. HW608 TaxID=1034889 RepID=UPI0008200E11|nr:succinate dehydrogenase [Variovorax sp. HW608]SCK18638.1 succinate dehydrogenase subunit C [Variovorax sp. HW608]
MKTARSHQAYWAFLGHRLSGLALALFLPAHFCVLGMALDAARLDRFLKLAEMPAMKFGEWGLVSLLSLHMFFGLRLLALELLPWSSTRDARLAWIGWGFAASMAFGFVFIAGVI